MAALELISRPAGDADSPASSSKSYTVPLSSAAGDVPPQVFAVAINGVNKLEVDATDGTVKIDGSAVQTAASVPRIGVLTETISAQDFTDGEATSGTYEMDGTIPAGALILGTRVLVPAGFAGDVSAALVIGNVGDPDRYLTGTPSIFTTAPTGVEVGVVSGAKLVLTAESPILTVTSATDAGLWIESGVGSVTVSIVYVVPS